MLFSCGLTRIYSCTAAGDTRMVVIDGLEKKSQTTRCRHTMLMLRYLPWVNYPLKNSKNKSHAKKNDKNHWYTYQLLLYQLQQTDSRCTNDLCFVCTTERKNKKPPHLSKHFWQFCCLWEILCFSETKSIRMIMYFSFFCRLSRAHVSSVQWETVDRKSFRKTVRVLNCYTLFGFSVL